jgi:hypothetical protein
MFIAACQVETSFRMKRRQPYSDMKFASQFAYSGIYLHFVSFLDKTSSATSVV